MAIAFVQEDSNETIGATSNTLTLPVAPTAGNLLIITVYNSNYDRTHTLTDDFTAATGILSDSVTNNRIWYKISLGTEQAVVISPSADTPVIDAHYSEWSGITSTPLDQVDTTAESSTTSQVCGPTGTLAQADELVIASAGHSGDAGTTHAWSDSFTALYDGGSLGQDRFRYHSGVDDRIMVRVAVQ
jgi:hypothetical protein